MGAVCSELHDVLSLRAAQQKEEQQQTQRKQTAQDVFEVFSSCCQRLVAYITANMATSPDLVQQMDRVILMCRSDATQRALHSVVTKDVWFR